jgi:1-deoxy-D-xylulose-5-phosphate synthase
VTKAFAQLENKALFSHYHFPFIKPLDSACIDQIIDTHEVIITLEDGVIKGGFGAQINSIIASKNYTISILNLGIPDIFIEHGTVFEQQHFCKIDVQSLIHLFNTFSDD